MQLADTQYFKSPVDQKTPQSGGGPLVDCVANPDNPGCARIIAAAKQQNDEVLQNLNPVNAISDLVGSTGNVMRYLPWIAGGVAALIILPMVFGRR